ncbi:MAG: DUF3240 family protein [Pseudomonadales bacterium]|jgi:hypothetical protein|nr:DUF3240 family protein [Pseudomonadales bacterium]
MRLDDVEEALVVFDLPRNLEETMIDWLLLRDHDSGFTSFETRGHSSCHKGLTPAEQVSGRAKRIQFEVHIPMSEVESLLSEAQTSLPATDVHYRVLPVIRGGHLATRETLEGWSPA